ncbi:hypothetical protein TNCV_3384631 [Trichonephila clavipes]|uniref:Uncharacterized protein n=1 Tax=Trichonephila clavipes TaxID=2585209 RepID=A0A8X6SV51_TRICX|nr:hypothetical protein TNCV_3384631 [Trichonephila clavipes]
MSGFVPKAGFYNGFLASTLGVSETLEYQEFRTPPHSVGIVGVYITQLIFVLTSISEKIISNLLGQMGEARIKVMESKIGEHSSKERTCLQYGIKNECSIAKYRLWKKLYTESSNGNW